MAAVPWTKRIVVAMLTLLAGGALAGSLFGERSVPEDEAAIVLRASRVVANLLDWLPEEHAPEDIVYDGIAGMLEVLDPHSNYLDPRSFRDMRARQQGSFFGVGIIISRREGQVTVIAPIADTPAARAGLRAGDIIAAVEETSTDTISIDEVVDLVRGPEGSEVRLTIVRPGLTDSFDVRMQRARIPQTSVRHAFMIRPGVGYLRLSEFSNTSVREVREALERLTDEGMRELIFDLRNNPGGPLDAAVGVSDLFLREGQLIVTTRGRTPDSLGSYSAPGRGYRFQGPLVVLVNEGSASASEIVAGAVQDHDRGLVLGETTWGKGLVQTVFTVRDTGLALTTARYYTASGRCIQRDYDSFIDYVTHRNGADPDSPATERFETAAGRTVLGGGGVAPDLTVVNRTLADSVARLYGSAAFFRFAIELLKDVPEAEQASHAATFVFADESQIADRFWGWVAEQEILDTSAIEAARADQQVTEDVGRALAVELLNSTLGLEAGFRLAIEGDDQFLAALEHLPDAADLWSAW